MAGRADVEAMRLGAAGLVAAALGIGESVGLADDLQVVAVEGGDATFAIELAAGDDSAAFLVYVFGLGDLSTDGTDGVGRLNAALATMAAAAELGAPGPRTVAHGSDERFGYVLATTPANLERLAGSTAPAKPARLLSDAERRRQRKRAAEQLSKHLTGAERAAEQWLEAVGDGSTDRLVEETELALRLLQPGHLDTLMRAVNRLIEPPGGKRG